MPVPKPVRLPVSARVRELYERLEALADLVQAMQAGIGALVDRLDLLEGRVRALEVLLGDEHKVKVGELDGLDIYPRGELDNGGSGRDLDALGFRFEPTIPGLACPSPFGASASLSVRIPEEGASVAVPADTNDSGGDGLSASTSA